MVAPPAKQYKPLRAPHRTRVDYSRSSELVIALADRFERAAAHGQAVTACLHALQVRHAPSPVATFTQQRARADGSRPGGSRTQTNAGLVAELGRTAPPDHAAPDSADPQAWRR